MLFQSFFPLHWFSLYNFRATSELAVRPAGGISFPSSHPYLGGNPYPPPGHAPSRDFRLPGGRRTSNTALIKNDAILQQTTTQFNIDGNNLVFYTHGEGVNGRYYYKHVQMNSSWHK